MPRGSLTDKRKAKGYVVWFWENWETATNKMVMKGAVTALYSSWRGKVVHPSSSGVIVNKGGDARSKRKIKLKKSSTSITQFLANRTWPNSGEMQKQRTSTSVTRTRNNQNSRAKKTQKVMEVIDLVGEESDFWS